MEKLLKRYYKKNEMYQKIMDNMNQMKPSEYALVSLDFDNFNYINDLFGYEVGDKVLKKMTECFDSQLDDDEFFTRIHADHFYFWIKVKEEPIEVRFLKITDLEKPLQELLSSHYSIIFSGGILIVKDKEEGISSMLDKANFARKQAKGHHTSNFVYYNDKLEDELVWKKIITLEMEEALENHEFEMYLQPKVLMKTGQLAGAEALVRWNSKNHGMIYPDQFIPVFEQNGFIRKIDFFMLNEACKFLLMCKTENKPMLPISVNFSKVNLCNKNFVEEVYGTINRYDIKPEFIEIEFTESIFEEHFDNLINITDQFKSLGFKVSLDDFGKAYSSLNYLKDVPLDVIKIDREFLNASSDSEKGYIMIGKIIEMIKALRFIPVMEGIETAEQAEFLQKLSCDIGQGYYFARPMPSQEYAKVLTTSDVVSNLENVFTKSHSVEELPQEFRMDNWELHILGQNIDMGLMKGYLDQDSKIQYVNDKALEYLGYTREEFYEKFQNSITAFTLPEDEILVKKALEKLSTSCSPLEFQIRAIRKDGKVIILQGKASSVIDEKGRPIGLYAFRDITEELERKEELKFSEEWYKFIAQQSEDIVFEWIFNDNMISFSKQYTQISTNIHKENKIDAEEFIQRRVHPYDIEKAKLWTKSIYKEEGYKETELRIRMVDDKYAWMKIRCNVIYNDKGEPVKAIGVLVNTTKEKEEIESLIREIQIDKLTRIYNKDEMKRRVDEYLKRNAGQKAAFLIVDIDDFRGVNDNLGHQFGDTILQEITQKIKRVFPESDIIGRLGGDEIGILMCDVENEETIKGKAELLNQVLKGTYFGTYSKYRISVSIGISRYPENATFFNTLYQLADVALLEAKHNGKDCYRIYQESMEGVAEETRTPMEGEERFINTYFAEDIIFHIFEMLYETKDIQTSIQIILEQLGRRFQVDRVYIFEIAKDGHTMNNTYEWCKEGVRSEKNNLQDLSTESFSEYFSSYNKDGILNCSNIKDMDTFSFKTLEKQGISSFLHCGIYDRGNIAGFVGFDDCAKNRVWRSEEMATLGYISRILSVFVIKQQTMEELSRSYERYVEMLDNLNGYVYVIDKKNYELLYVNKAMKELDAKIGQKCYEIAFFSDTPCANCPAARLTEEKPYATEEIYSVRVNGWVNSAASKVKWNGEKDAALVCCTDISKYKR